MKSILVADNRPDLLATLEPILKHWGYRVLSARKAEQITAFLQESSPCLLIIGEALFADRGLVLSQETKQRINAGGLPVIALKQDGEEITEMTPSETLVVIG